MDTIFLYNQNNDKFPTDVVRYFKLNDKKYFIFTLNEVDENGYIQLYVSRIENEYGKLVMKYISDDAEWHAFKDEIEKIVKNNRNGVKAANDLKYNELDGMVVTEFRIFKLKESVAKELGMNKDARDDDEPKSLEAASARNTDLTIEEILKQVSEKAKGNKEEEYYGINSNTYDFTDEDYTSMTKKDEDDVVPTVSASDNNEYKAKYEDALKTIKNLENENIRLINELVEYKAKIATVKDIIG